MSVQALSWVFDHSPTTGSDRLVLLSIANHAGKSPVDEAWEAYPGIATLQRETKLERSRTVNDALARLVEHGDVERIINGAPDERIRKDRRPNLYRILLTNGVTCNDTRCSWCGVTDGAARGDASRHDGVTDGANPSRSTGCRETSPEPIPLTVSEPSEVTALAIRDPFDEFWDTYPRKAGKGAARKAWTKALAKVGGVEVLLIAAAARFAADPNRDPRYTAHPATWLNQERWEDEALPSRTSAPSMGANQTNISAALAALDAWEDRHGEVGSGASVADDRRHVEAGGHH